MQQPHLFFYGLRCPHIGHRGAVVVLQGFGGQVPPHNRPLLGDVQCRPEIKLLFVRLTTRGGVESLDLGGDHSHDDQCLHHWFLAGVGSWTGWW